MVRWHEVRGGAAWDEIAAALERGDAPSSAALEQAAAHLEAARDAGLLVPLDLRRRIASLAELRGRPELATRELSAVIAEDPDDAEARGRLARIHLARGVQLARRGAHARAARHLERAAELDPEDATARTSLGAALAELGRLDEAIDATREAVRLAPRDAAAHANLGLLLAARRDPNGARAHLRRALTLDPDDARARAALAALSPNQEAP
ncbi:MAG: tetratricopeptide repeat protein [Sandaracinaceae bacterium]|nr:tetratricopeptide repeat protein [Sandaracinaceae bacterium]